MKTIINITVDSSVAFKFVWNEKNSFISHVGSIIPADQRTKKNGVVRLSATKPITFNKGEKNERTIWEDQITVPVWIKRAVDWAFIVNESSIVCGSKFTIECDDLGSKPKVEGLKAAVDTSWMSVLPTATPTKKEDKKAIDPVDALAQLKTLMSA